MYDIVFDDDSSGEAADIVAFKVDDEHLTINIEFYHLKYSHGDNPRARIDDLCEFCGQTQKSIFWVGKKYNGYDLCKHLISRKGKRISNQETTGFDTKII